MSHEKLESKPIMMRFQPICGHATSCFHTGVIRQYKDACTLVFKPGTFRPATEFLKWNLRQRIYYKNAKFGIF